MYVAGCDRTRAANEQNCVKDTLQGLSNLAGSKLQLREVVLQFNSDTRLPEAHLFASAYPALLPACVMCLND